MSHFDPFHDPTFRPFNTPEEPPVQFTQFNPTEEEPNPAEAVDTFAPPPTNVGGGGPPMAPPRTGRYRFAPKGRIPEWQILWNEAFAHASYGDVITYDTLDSILGRTFIDNRRPIYRVRAELGDRRQMWLEAVPTIGYKIMLPHEHTRVSNKHKRKGRRQFGLMKTVSDVTNLSLLSPSELNEWDTQAKVNGALYAIACHHENRLLKIETTLRNAGLL